MTIIKKMLEAETNVTKSRALKNIVPLIAHMHMDARDGRPDPVEFIAELASRKCQPSEYRPKTLNNSPVLHICLHLPGLQKPRSVGNGLPEASCAEGCETTDARESGNNMPLSQSGDTEDLTAINVLISTIVPVQVELCWRAVREFGELSAYAPELQVCGARRVVHTSMLVRLL